jgi:hypothetical protein
MDFLAWFVWEKKIEANCLCGICVAHQRHAWQTVCKYTVYPYLFVLYYLRFPRDLQEVEKNRGEKRVDIAKRLGLPASTSNSIFAKKNEIREQIQKCDNTCKNRKTGNESTFAALENIPKTDSLCYYVLIVMEVTNKCWLWPGNPRNQGASRMLKNCQLNTTRIVKHGWRQRFFVRCSIL